MRDFFATVTFAEDIREERGHKTTWVGVHDGPLLVESAPCLLGKFAIIVDIHNFTDKDIGEVNLRVKSPGEDEYETKFLGVNFAFDEGYKANSSAKSMWRGALIASPFAIGDVGDIEVTANINGEDVFIGRLPVKISRSKGDAN